MLSYLHNAYFKPNILFITFLFFFKNPTCFTQNTLNPTFSEFKGTSYKIPARQKIIGYGEFIYQCEMAGTTVLEEINIPECNYKTPFPGLEFMHRFGIIFESEMTISKKAVYVFSLNSDDGSILWINNKKIIDNDRTHKMTIKSDTIILEKGSYPIKIWYFQGFPDRYGIEFKSTFYEEYDPEKDREFSPLTADSKKVFTSTMLPFETNSYYLTNKGMQTMDSLAAVLNTLEIKKISIAGHTDSIGPEDFNLQLSIKRATTIQKEFIKRLENKKIEFVTNGFGESQPVTTNKTELGRSKNRRVEINISN